MPREEEELEGIEGKGKIRVLMQWGEQEMEEIEERKIR